MYKIGIKHNGISISEKIVSGYGLMCITFILDYFENNFGLDIGSYKLTEYKYTSESFILDIRTEDLIYIRNKEMDEYIKEEKIRNLKNNKEIDNVKVVTPNEIGDSIKLK